MRKILTVGLAAAALAATAASVAAKTSRPQPADILPSYQILSVVQWAGLSPTSLPILRGRYYFVRAVDSRGVELRIVTDAYFGTILSLTPTQPYGVYYSLYGGGARIIQVSQPGKAQAAPQYRYDQGSEVIVVPSQNQKKQ